MLRIFLVAIASTALTMTVAEAARLTEVEGTVLVNRGDGFWEVNGTTTVSAGDRVLVRGKGRARIDFGGGCMKKVLSQQTFVVSSRPICDAPTALASSTPSIPTKAPMTLRDIPRVATANAIAPARTISEQHLAIIGMLVTGGTVALASAGMDGKHWSNQGTAMPSDGNSGDMPSDGSSASMPSDGRSGTAMPSDGSSAAMPSAADSQVSASQHFALASAAAGAVPDAGSEAARTQNLAQAEDRTRVPAVLPVAATEGPGSQNLEVVNNLVVARTDFAANALEGGDNTDGTPASP